MPGQYCGWYAAIFQEGIGGVAESCIRGEQGDFEERVKGGAEGRDDGQAEAD
jgi:hypothetical protein